MDYKELLNQAQLAISNVKNDQVFTLKDLFEGHEWKSISVGERLQLGKNFKNAVMSNKVVNVKYCGKADNNSAQYVKQEEYK